MGFLGQRLAIRDSRLEWPVYQFEVFINANLHRNWVKKMKFSKSIKIRFCIILMSFLFIRLSLGGFPIGVGIFGAPMKNGPPAEAAEPLG